MESPTCGRCNDFVDGELVSREVPAVVRARSNKTYRSMPPVDMWLCEECKGVWDRSSEFSDYTKVDSVPASSAPLVELVIVFKSGREYVRTYGSRDVAELVCRREMASPNDDRVNCFIRPEKEEVS